MNRIPGDSPRKESPYDYSAESSTFLREQEEEKNPFYQLKDWPKSFDGLNPSTFTNFALARLLRGILLGNVANGIISTFYIAWHKQSMVESVLDGLVSGTLFAIIASALSSYYSVRIPATFCFIFKVIPSERILRAVAGRLGCMLIAVMMLMAHAFSNYPSDNSAAIIFFTALIARPLFSLYGSMNRTPKIGKKVKIFIPVFFGFGIFGLFLLASLIVYAPWYFVVLIGSTVIAILLVLSLDWVGRTVFKLTFKVS